MSHPIQQGATRKKWPWWVRATGWILGLVLVATTVSWFILGGQAARHAGGKDGYQKDVEAKTMMWNLQLQLGVHRMSKGTYPTDKEGLAALFPQTDDKEQIGESDEVREKLLDPWRRRFRYRCPGLHNKNSYDLYSLGSDGIEDTEDDIKNW